MLLEVISFTFKLVFKAWFATWVNVFFGVLILFLECALGSSWVSSISGYRCIVFLSSFYGFCSCLSIRGLGRNYRWFIVRLSIFDRI